MVLPRTSIPKAGLQISNVQDIKRARPDFVSVAGAIAGAVRPNGDNMIGVGSHATAGRYSDISRPWVFKAKPFKNWNWTEELLEDSLMFIFRQNTEPTWSRSDVNRVIMLGLPQIHYQVHVQTLEKPDAMGPEDVLKMWMLTGPLTSHPPLEGNVGQERGVVVPSRGDFRVVNYWGNNVRGGDFCWLVVKEVPVFDSDKYITGYNGVGFYTPGTRRADGKGNITHVTRFVPVLSESAYTVPFESLQYEKDCKTCFGIPLYVGRCIRNTSYNPSAARDKVISPAPTLDMGKQGSAGRIEMYGIMATDRPFTCV